MGNVSFRGIVGLVSPRYAGAISIQAGKPCFPGRVSIHYPSFPERWRRLPPHLWSHISRRAELLSLFGIFQCQQQNQPKGLFNCNIYIYIKNHAFSREKRRVSTPLVFSVQYVSADSVPFKSKQAHSSSRKVPFKRTLSIGLYFTSNVPKPN